MNILKQFRKIFCFGKDLQSQWLSGHPRRVFDKIKGVENLVTSSTTGQKFDIFLNIFETLCYIPVPWPPCCPGWLWPCWRLPRSRPRPWRWASRRPRHSHPRTRGHPQTLHYALHAKFIRYSSRFFVVFCVKLKLYLSTGTSNIMIILILQVWHNIAGSTDLQLVPCWVLGQLTCS